jgi:hypothetical protein
MTTAKRHGPPRASWTYRLGAPDAATAVLDGYSVWPSDGSESVGTVSALLRRGDEELLVVEHGSLPLVSDLRVVPLADVREIDHAALAVRLRVDAGRFAQMLGLDPALAVESGPAEAEEVAELSVALEPPPAFAEEGPVDSSQIIVALGLLLASVLSVMAVVAFLSLRDHSSWVWLLIALPVTLAAGAAVAACQAYRRPYRRRGSGQRVTELSRQDV